MDQFTAWNKAVGQDCAGFWAAYYCCVHVAGAGTTSPGATPTSDPVPSPHQTGITESCDKFYKVAKGDSCDSVTSKFGISKDQLVKWNSAIDKDCNGFWAEYYICVHAAGASTTSPGPTPTSDPVPTPHQTGITKDCDKYYKVVKGDTCDSVTQKFGFNRGLLVKWNTAIDKDCNGLWADNYICVRIKGYKPTSTPTKPTSTGPTAPGPTQTGIVKDCRDWYVAKSGDYCDKIVQGYSSFDKKTFIQWNPAVGKDCAGIWVKYAYCVGKLA